MSISGIRFGYSSGLVPRFGKLSERGGQRLDYARMDADVLMAEIRQLDTAIQGRKPRERAPMDQDLFDAVDVLIMKLEAVGPNSVYFRNGCTAIDKLKTKLSPELEEKYIRLNARQFI